ncbi:hypothetical protein [Lagierella sp.]|uniref:hypothetical protein n=1 Tax=Lagierella sp. TaxID=2849657 RepID=UPI002635BE5D|nr:hypothetical protein [Lagierella sp.]
MKRDEIYKKMGFWNGFYLVIGVIGLLFSIYNIVDTFFTKSYIKNLEKIGLDPADFEPSTFEKVILVLVTVISIYCVVIAFKNRRRIIEKLKVNILPYALTLLIAAFNFVSSLLQRFTGEETQQVNDQVAQSMEGVGENALIAGLVVFIVGIVIVLLVKLLPAIRMLMLNSKLQKLPEEEESMYE